jgi:hypothetical protein
MNKDHIFPEVHLFFEKRHDSCTSFSVKVKSSFRLNSGEEGAPFNSTNKHKTQSHWEQSSEKVKHNPCPERTF